MELDMLNIILFLVGILVALGVGLKFLLAIAAQHFKGSRGGWAALATAYASTIPSPIAVTHRHTLLVGRVMYRNCVTVGQNLTGLYLSLGSPMSVFGARPLFIPWSEITKIEVGRLFWREAMVLWIGSPYVASITVPMHFFEKIVRPHIVRDR